MTKITDSTNKVVRILEYIPAFIRDTSTWFMKLYTGIRSELCNVIDDIPKNEPYIYCLHYISYDPTEDLQREYDEYLEETRFDYDEFPTNLPYSY